MNRPPPPDAREVALVLDAVNAMFTRERHHHDGPPSPAVEASHASVAYIESFWPCVSQRIAADPRRLGLAVQDSVGHWRTLTDIQNVPEVRAAAEQDANALAVLAPLRMMIETLNAATDDWAAALRSADAPLPYHVDAERYVSLRTLLGDRRGPGAGAIGANAPTLVMGGTTTAITMCWNLLRRLPAAWLELTGRAPTQSDMAALWHMSRELLFRIGGGSLIAFVSLASACTERQSDLLWRGMDDLSLSTVDGRPVWILNEAMFQRMLATVTRIHAAQQGHYVGCAALYARAAPLPLADTGADSEDEGIDPSRRLSIFGELLRWIGAVARAEYFPRFGA